VAKAFGLDGAADAFDCAADAFVQLRPAER
jgi:hypothetical protein